MNVSRGLFRAWIVVSVIWSLCAGAFAYVVISPDTVRGRFQPAGSIKDGLPPWQVDSNRPFYDVMRSPSAEKLSVQFFPVDWQKQIDWEKDASMMLVDLPDQSRLYIHAKYNDADKNYIAAQFWAQRWSRWGYAALIVCLWAVIPCLLIFAVGYALLWVGRGFKTASRPG